jgi:hypothetical protein
VDTNYTHALQQQNALRTLRMHIALLEQEKEEEKQKKYPAMVMKTL